MLGKKQLQSEAKNGKYGSKAIAKRLIEVCKLVTRNDRAEKKKRLRKKSFTIAPRCAVFEINSHLDFSTPCCKDIRLDIVFSCCSWGARAPSAVVMSAITKRKKELINLT